MLKPVRLCALLAALLAPTAALAEPPVWVIKDANSTITLFGSVHILPKVEWRPAKVTQALKTADDVWFEIPLDEASQLAAMQASVRQAMLPPGQTLSGMLDAPTRERLARVGRSVNITVEYLDRLRPWMADLALSQAFVAKMGGLATQGVEQVLYKEVPKTAQLKAFETGPQQIGILAGLPQGEQVAALKETLRQIEEEPESFDDVVAQWIKADVAGLTAEALDPIRKTSPAYYEALITKRNADWVKQIKARLAGSGETLMVVGVGHLVGPDSVPAMLRKEGVKVEGP